MDSLDPKNAQMYARNPLQSIQPAQSEQDNTDDFLSRVVSEINKIQEQSKQVPVQRVPDIQVENPFADLIPKDQQHAVDVPNVPLVPVDVPAKQQSPVPVPKNRQQVTENLYIGSPEPVKKTVEPVESGSPLDVIIANGGIKREALKKDLGWTDEEIAKLPEGVVSDTGKTLLPTKRALKQAGLDTDVGSILDIASRPEQAIEQESESDTAISAEKQGTEKAENVTSVPESKIQNTPVQAENSEMAKTVADGKSKQDYFTAKDGSFVATVDHIGNRHIMTAIASDGRTKEIGVGKEIEQMVQDGRMLRSSKEDVGKWLKGKGLELPSGTSHVQSADTVQSETSSQKAKGKVVEFSGEELGGLDVPIKTLKIRAANHARKHFSDKTVTVASDGSQVLIPWQGIKHALTGRVHPVSAVVTSKLDTLIENGVLVKIEQDKKDRPDIKAAYFYDTPINIGGKESAVRIVVREHVDGKRYYDHFEVRDNIPSDTSTRSNASVGLTEQVTGSMSGSTAHQPNRSVGEMPESSVSENTSPDNKTIKENAPELSERKETETSEVNDVSTDEAEARGQESLLDEPEKTGKRTFNDAQRELKESSLRASARLKEAARQREESSDGAREDAKREQEEKEFYSKRFISEKHVPKIVDWLKSYINVDITPYLNSQFQNNRQGGALVSWNEIPKEDQRKIERLYDKLGLENNGGLGRIIYDKTGQITGVPSKAQKKEHAKKIKKESVGKAETEPAAFSRSADKTSGLDIEEAKRIADELAKEYENAPELVVVEKASDLPFKAFKDVKGAFWNGRCYLVVSNISDYGDATSTFAHETIGHYGLRGFFGDRLSDTLVFLRDHNPRIEKLAQDWYRTSQDYIELIRKNEAKDWTDQQFNDWIRDVSLEDALVELAENGEKISGIKKLAVLLQRLLRAIGLDKLADKLEAKTDAEALMALHKAELFVRSGKDIKVATAVDVYAKFSRSAMKSVSQNDEPALFSLEENNRVNVSTTLNKLSRQLSNEEISQEDFNNGVNDLLDKINQKNWNKPIRERVRGADWVKERLLRARRNGELDSETVDFGIWLINKNPEIADDLGISLKQRADMSAGAYFPVERIINLVKYSSNKDTAVHEILHHTERMMPKTVREGILSLYKARFDSAYAKADEKTKALMLKMVESQSGNKPSRKEVMDAFAKGELDYDFYQYFDTSEFWAVNGTRLLKMQYAENSWIGKAKVFIREVFHYLKNRLGLDSDAPILKGIQSVLNGDGSFKTNDMLNYAKTRLKDISKGNLVNQKRLDMDAPVPDRPPARKTFDAPDITLSAKSTVFRCRDMQLFDRLTYSFL